MKEHTTRLGLIAAVSAVGLVASGCAARQTGGDAGDDRRSQYDTTGTMDTSGTGYGEGGTYGGRDTASAQDTGWQSPPERGPQGYPGTGLPGEPGDGGAGSMDTMGQPGFGDTSSDSVRLNPFPGMGAPGEGTGTGGSGGWDTGAFDTSGYDNGMGTGDAGGTGTGGTDIIPEIDSVDPEGSPTADSLDVPDWNSGGGY